MHPECDEMLQVLEGEIEVEVLPADGGAGVVTRVPAGSMVVVPRGCWHKFQAPQGVMVMTMTPGPTDHFAGETPTD